MKKLTFISVSVVAALILIACGGGGGDSPAAEGPITTPHAPPVSVTPVHYTDRVYTYWGGTAGYPELTTLDGKRVRVKNMTEWPDGLGGLLNCWAGDKAQPDGMIPQACMSGYSPDRHYDLYIDPSTNELRRYAVAPTNVVWVKQTYDPARVPPAHPDWTSVTTVDSGQLFIRQDSTNVLRLLTSEAESVVITGDPVVDGPCYLVMSYRN